MLGFGGTGNRTTRSNTSPRIKSWVQSFEILTYGGSLKEIFTVLNHYTFPCCSSQEYQILFDYGWMTIK